MGTQETDRIETARLVLRPFTRADEDAVFENLSNFEVSKWLARIPHPFPRSEVRIVAPDGSSRWPGLMAVTLEGAVIGAVGTKGHLGYWFAPHAWGQGFATEAAGAALGFVFQDAEVTEVLSNYFVGNDGSRRVLEKLGFEETGRGPHFCAARDCDLPNVQMRLARTAWEHVT